MSDQKSPITRALQRVYDAVRDRGVEIKPTRWQSMDVSKLREATTREVLNLTVQFPVYTEDLDQLRADIEPNTPWADDHFLERVGGLPLNPGVEWAHWPWGNSANSFRTQQVPVGPHNPITGNEIIAGEYAAAGFDHTYAERMWPKMANRHPDTNEFGDVLGPPSRKSRLGIRFDYGDAMDIVEHLAKAPDSRQAYLPIWFPEDTGKLDVRVPCTLGYHFIQRGGYLHCTYYIRSCDLYRHFRDDVYLTVRLQLWMLEKLRATVIRHTHGGVEQNPFWHDVKPGLFTMHVVSMHCFINDCHRLWPGHTWR